MRPHPAQSQPRKIHSRPAVHRRRMRESRGSRGLPSVALRCLSYLTIHIVPGCESTYPPPRKQPILNTGTFTSSAEGDPMRQYSLSDTSARNQAASAGSDKLSNLVSHLRRQSPFKEGGRALDDGQPRAPGSAARRGRSFVFCACRRVLSYGCRARYNRLQSGWRFWQSCNL